MYYRLLTSELTDLLGKYLSTRYLPGQEASSEEADTRKRKFKQSAIETDPVVQSKTRKDSDGGPDRKGHSLSYLIPFLINLLLIHDILGFGFKL